MVTLQSQAPLTALKRQDANITLSSGLNFGPSLNASNTGNAGNSPQYPAAVLGGRRGGPGIGLSVAATRPDGTVADFSTHNRFVSLAAPGAGPFGCEYGLLSTLPAATGTEWDTPESCSLLVPEPRRTIT